MTPEEVREKLGLKPWPEFEAEAMERLERMRPDLGRGCVESYIAARRMTGKSTKAMVFALAALSEGHEIAMVGRTREQEHRLRERLRMYAVTLQLDMKRIRDPRDARRGGTKIVLYYDHDAA